MFPLVPQTTPIARLASFRLALMQIDTVKFKPLIEAEKLRRRTNNLCFYCDSSLVPSKACQTSSTSCGNSPRVGKQEHPVVVGTVRLDLTQHHLCKGSCFTGCPSPSFTQYVDIIRIPEDIPQVLALVDSGATSSFIDQTFVAQHNIPVVKK